LTVAPLCATILPYAPACANVAQLVEQLFRKQQVRGSSPRIGSTRWASTTRRAGITPVVISALGLFQEATREPRGFSCGGSSLVSSLLQSLTNSSNAARAVRIRSRVLWSFGIEEPENHLHPRLLPELSEESREASARTQLMSPRTRPSSSTSYAPKSCGCSIATSRAK
jgi:hypothetical protein